MKNARAGMIVGIFSAMVMGSPIAMAQNAPRSFEASPDVYKEIAESDMFLVILATWKPGQRDKPH
jgi:hypothetical protein